MEIQEQPLANFAEFGALEFSLAEVLAGHLNLTHI